LALIDETTFSKFCHMNTTIANLNLFQFGYSGPWL